MNTNQPENFPNLIPGWLGTLVVNFNRTVIYSAGALENNLDLVPKFVELGRRLSQYAVLEGPDAMKDNPFKRLCIVGSRHAYVVTVSEENIYVVKRRLPPSEAHGEHSANTSVNV